MERQSPAIFRVLAYAGVYVGAVIGAGYASYQEILQFFAGYGFIGIAGAIITTILLAWYGAVFMELGYRLKTNSHKVVCRYLCGNLLGGLADYVLLFFMFGMITIMISGHKHDGAILWLESDDRKTHYCLCHFYHRLFRFFLCH